MQQPRTMDDFQKLMALKKAYAEIILGMAKEAAARVMAAERRSSQSQEELLGSKGEALRLLLRLKQMFDAKLSEAEKTSQWQQGRIQELEAQLQEAENTIKDLREELESERTYKLHEVSKTRRIGDPKAEEVLGGNRHYTSGCIGQSRSDSRTAYEVSGMNISSHKQSVGSNCSCKGQALNDYCCVHNRSFSVTVMRGKEPKLKRNKGTQIVQAFEKNSSAQLPFSGQKDIVEHGTYSGGREAIVSAGMSNLSVNKKYERKRELSALEVLKADYNEIIGAYVKKRKRTPRCRTKNTSWGKQHDLTLTKQRAADVFSFGTSKESHPPWRLRSPSEATEATEKSGALVTHKDTELVKFGIMVDANKRSQMLKESKIVRQGDGGVQHLNILATKSDQAKINDLSNSDQKASSVSNGISGRPLEKKPLKFTFTRRKKETLHSPNGTFCGGDIPSKKKGRKHACSSKSENSAPTCETSEESQQLMQIAEQLIYMARNKWE